jgi:hypothetical protein
MAIEKLSEAMQGVDAKRQPDLAIRIANAVLDRTRGKPVANVKMDNTLSVLVSNVKTDKALLDRIRQDLIAGTYGDVVIEQGQ